eukprot:Gb_09229 [translate_table: standard]
MPLENSHLSRRGLPYMAYNFSKGYVGLVFVLAREGSRQCGHRVDYHGLIRRPYSGIITVTAVSRIYASLVFSNVFFWLVMRVKTVFVPVFKMLKVGHLGELPILNEVTAHKTAWSLRNPSTGSLKKSPVNETSAANATWKSPPCREMSMRHYCAEDTQDNQLVRIGLSKESRELMPADAVEKSDLATRQNSSIRLNFKNSTLLQDCQREMKEIMEVAERYSYERELFQENASSSFIRRDTHEGKEGLLFNWGNQTQKIECKMNESIEATLHRDGVFAANGRTGESSGPAAKPETPGPEREHCNDIGNHGEAKRMTKQGRRDSASKGTSWESKNDLASQCGGSFSPFMLNLMDEFQNSAQTLSLLSTEEEPFDKQEFRNCEGVGFPRIHKRAPNSNYKSYSGCSLHSTESPKFQEKQAKGHEKSNYNNLPKDIGRRLDDSSTPTSMYYFHGSKNCDGSSDGTWVSGYDKMEGLDLPRNGHVIPCHASRSPKYRTNDHVECSERSSRHCFSNSMRKKCGDVAWNHQNALPRESTLASCKSKGSVRMLDSCTEALPLVDNGEIAALSGEDRLDGPLTEYEILELEATSKLDGKRMSNRRICEKLVIALTCRREELEIHKDANVSFNQKYRPRSFDELVGQTMVVQSLVNVILKGRVAPAYLFQGPRGTGKTSTARIFAAALNCVSVEEIRPCGFCPECSAFASGKSSDVREVDAADTNGIERVKALLKSIALTPSFPRFKVFIIDECHMLSWETWAVLLKSLEVLSGHVVFIFITTDPDKLSHAAVSRCQKYLFTKIKDSEIASRLQKLAFEENLDVDSDALDLIAAKSDGSLRDAEMMLDQLSLLGQRINLALVHELILGCRIWMKSLQRFLKWDRAYVHSGHILLELSDVAPLQILLVEQLPSAISVEFSNSTCNRNSYFRLLEGDEKGHEATVVPYQQIRHSELKFKQLSSNQCGYLQNQHVKMDDLGDSLFNSSRPLDKQIPAHVSSMIVPLGDSHQTKQIPSNWSKFQQIHEDMPSMVWQQRRFCQITTAHIKSLVHL